MNLQHVREPEVAVLNAPDSAEDACLEHLLECDTCLETIADLRLSTKLCEVRCPEFRALMARRAASRQRGRIQPVVLAS